MELNTDHILGILRYARSHPKMNEALIAVRVGELDDVDILDSLENGCGFAPADAIYQALVDCEDVHEEMESEKSPKPVVHLDPFIPEIAAGQHKVDDILTSLAHTILHKSDVNYCLNPNHRSADNQEDHTDSDNCLYYTLLRAIRRELVNF